VTDIIESVRLKQCEDCGVWEFFATLEQRWEKYWREDQMMILLPGYRDIVCQDRFECFRRSRMKMDWRPR
jgi:hypothetical protein